MKGYEDLVALLKKVQATHGIDTDIESINNYSDMIGHSSVDQLKELANGVYKETFYRVYGLCYGTVEAIRFFTKNSDKIEAILRSRDEAICDLEDMQDKLKKADDETKRAWDKSLEMRSAWEAEKTEKENIKKELEKANEEIIRLKAKLYDLMEK